MPSLFVSHRSKNLARTLGVTAESLGAVSDLVGFTLLGWVDRHSGFGFAGSVAFQASASFFRRATMSGCSFATSLASARSSVRRCNSTRAPSAVIASFQSPSRTARRGHQSGSALLPCQSQKMGPERGTGLPSKAASRFSPSPRYSAGNVTPAAAQRVGSKSTAVNAVVLFFTPGGVWLGQRTIKGTRTPPSNRLRLRPRRTPVSPLL